MKNARKVFSLALVVMLCLSLLLTGCGTTKPTTQGNTPAANEGTNTAPAATTSGTAEATAEPLKPYVIDWYYTGNGPQADQEKIETEMNKMLTDINATVKLHPFDWGSYEQKMQVILATGEKVDLLFSATWGSNIFQNVRKGYLTDLTELLPQYAPDAVNVLKGPFLDASKIDGKNYGVPVYKELAWGAGVLLNKKLVDKYGFDISNVKTPEDLEPMFQVIKEKEPGVAAVEAITGQSPIILNPNRDATAAGISYDTLGGTDKFMICTQDPEMIKYWKLVRQYFQAGYIRKDAATVKDPLPDEKAGKVFSIWMGLKPGKDAEMSVSTGVDWVQIPLTKQYIQGTAAFGCMMAVGKSSQDPARTLMFYNKFYKDEKIVNLLNFGIEGEHYVKKSEKVIDFASENSMQSWNVGTPWMFGDQRLSYLFPNEDPNKWEAYQKWNDEATVAPNVGFTFDSESVKNETVAIQNITNEFAGALDTGTVDTDTYVAKFEEKLKAAGVEKILAEVNKQYEAYKAKQK